MNTFNIEDFIKPGVKTLEDINALAKYIEDKTEVKDVFGKLDKDNTYEVVHYDNNPELWSLENTSTDCVVIDSAVYDLYMETEVAEEDSIADNVLTLETSSILYRVKFRLRDYRRAFVNKKNNTLYEVVDFGVTNATNKNDGEQMYLYTSLTDYKVYVRNAVEFKEKFEKYIPKLGLYVHYVSGTVEEPVTKFIGPYRTVKALKKDIAEILRNREILDESIFRPFVVDDRLVKNHKRVLLQLMTSAESSCLAFFTDECELLEILFRTLNGDTIYTRTDNMITSRGRKKFLLVDITNKNN